METQIYTDAAIFTYEQAPITFWKGDYVMVNATDMAKAFRRRPGNWLRLNQTEMLIASASSVTGIPIPELLVVKQGGTQQGTWMHEDIALEFAHWLSPKFYLWCNDCIKKFRTRERTPTHQINNGTIFSHPSFGTIRVEGTPTNPLFCLADLCRPLDLVAGKVASRLTRDVISKRIIFTTRGEQLALFVNEEGMYDVLLNSRRLVARAFRKWITSEVLPSIRQTGGYIDTTEQGTPEMIMAKALQVATEIIQRHEQKALAKENEVTHLTEEDVKLKKGGDYLALILDSDGTATVAQIAADYGLSAPALNKKLNELRIQRKVGGQWILYAEHMGKGYVHSRTVSFQHCNGRPDLCMQTEWTQQGRIFLYYALREVGVLPLIEQKGTDKPQYNSRRGATV